MESPQAVQKMLSLVQNSKVKSTNAQISNLPPTTGIRPISPAPQLLSTNINNSTSKKFSNTGFVAQIKRMPSFGGINKDLTPTTSANLPPLGKLQ